MIGFPYNYGDDLTSTNAKKNRELFLKKYGSTIIINSVLFVFTKQVNAKDKVPNQCVAEAPKPSPQPVFAPIFPPSSLIQSRLWTTGGLFSLGWICLTAAATGEPTLVAACTSIAAYAIAKK